MLVITRKIGEEIKIGDTIVIKILDLQRGKVRFGVEAPRDYLIVFKEKIDGDISSDGCKQPLP